MTLARSWFDSRAVTMGIVSEIAHEAGWNDAVGQVVKLLRKRKRDSVGAEAALLGELLKEVSQLKVDS